jgi:hypothetical protein
MFKIVIAAEKDVILIIYYSFADFVFGCVYLAYDRA